MSTMQNTQYLTAEVHIDHAPQDVLAAVLDVRRWWTENLIGHSAAVGDEFVFTDDSAYPGETSRSKEGIRFCRFRVTEVSPTRVAWHAVDCETTFIEDRHEWRDTDVVIDITPAGTGTDLRLTHVGLTAASQCFDACSRGWSFYVRTSIPQLVTTGTGQPIPRYADPDGAGRTAPSETRA